VYINQILIALKFSQSDKYSQIVIVFRSVFFYSEIIANVKGKTNRNYFMIIATLTLPWVATLTGLQHKIFSRVKI
jgi:hypothetical protein